MKWLVLLVGMICSVGVKATDVNSVSSLISALGSDKATDIGNNTVRLTDNVSLSSTLTFTGGTIILDLNGKELSLSTVNKDAMVFSVNSGNLTIKGNGLIKAKASWEVGSWSSKYNAIALSYNGGQVHILGARFEAEKYYKGTAYTLDPNNGRTVADMIPNGAYMTNSNDYSSTGLVATSTTVVLTNYKISYNPNGGQMASTNAEYNLETVDDFQLPTEGAILRKGYTFVGWKENGTNVDKDYLKSKIQSSGHVASVDMTFIANWKAIDYTVTYFNEGKDITSTVDRLKTYQIGNNTTLPTLKRSEADFLGWKDRSTGQMITNLPGNDPRNLELDAIWDKKYNITFVTGTEESILKISTATSKEVSIPTPKEKKGYTFEYWSDGKGNAIHDKISANVYDSDITLTAVWSPITYHVIFKDGEETKETKEYTIESGLSDFPTIRKDGYVFNSWLNENRKPVSSISKGIIGDKTFTTDWTEITYTLTYDYADGETPSSSDKYKYTETAQTQIRSASRKGYNFLGWFLPGSTDKLEKVPTLISDTQKEFLFTATAKWEIQNYKVIFYLNDGTGAVLSEKEYTYNVNTGIPEEDMPKDVKRTGYDFGGWFGNEACTGDKIENVSAGAGELKLYAKWTPKTYTITYDMQGGTNASNAPSSFIYNEGCLLPSENVKQDHYVFTGWTTEATSTTYVKSIPANTEGNQKFYAQWTPCVYTISYITNTETALPAQSYLYGTEVKTKKTYKEGYTLTWCYDAALTRPFGDLITADKIPAGTGDELALYAKWTPTEYIITYDTYYGKITSGKVEKYTIEQEVKLPTDIHREGFTFAGWYADDLLKEKVTKIEKGSSGNKTFYATWDRGYQLIVTQPSYGKISVTRNGTILPAGTMIGKGESLTVTAEATDANYELKELVIDGKAYTSSPQLVAMPEKDLKITATFTEASRPAASAPEIILTPSGVDKFPKGEDVKVRLKKTDEATTLYYRLDGSPEGLFGRVPG